MGGLSIITAVLVAWIAQVQCQSPVSSTLVASQVTAFNASSPKLPVVGPLTTAFSQPKYCNLVFIKSVTVSETTTYLDLTRDVTCGPSGTLSFAPECFPNGTTTQTTSIMYSPAAGCPIGYHGISEPGASSSVLCCPAAYVPDVTICGSSMPLKQGSIEVHHCLKWSGTTPVVATATLDHWSVTTSPVRWDATSKLTIDKSMILLPTVFAQPVTLTGVSNFTVFTKKPLLTKRAIAGIAVGGFFAIVLFFALCCVFMSRRRRHQKPPPGGAQFTVRCESPI